MAKDRARRRAQREQEIAARAAERAAQAARDARRRGAQDRLRKLLPTPRARQTGVLATRRRARNRVLFAVLVLVQVAAWAFGRSFAISALVFVFTLLAAPVASLLLHDR